MEKIPTEAKSLSANDEDSEVAARELEIKKTNKLPSETSKDEPEEAAKLQAEGWIKAGDVVNLLHKDWRSIAEVVEKYRNSNPEWFKKLRIKTSPGTLYSPQLLQIIKEQFPEKSFAPELWKTKRAITIDLGTSEGMVEHALDEYSKQNSATPDNVRSYPIKINKSGEIQYGPEFPHYSPEVVNFVKNFIDKFKTDFPVALPLWETTHSLVKRFESSGKLKAGAQHIDKIAEKYRTNHPDWFRNFRKSAESVGVHEYYSPELVQQTEKEIVERRDVPVNWKNRFDISDTTGRTPLAIKKIADEYLETHPEWFLDRQMEDNPNVTVHYAPPLVEEILKRIKEKPHASEEWQTASKLSAKLKIDYQTLRKRAIQIAEKAGHPEWIEEKPDRRFRMAEHFSQELVNLIQVELENEEKPEEDWVSLSSLAKEFDKDYTSFRQNVRDDYGTEHPEWIPKLNTRRGEIEYAVGELVVKLRERFGKEEPPPENWKTNEEVVEICGVTKPIIHAFAKQNAVAHAEWTHIYVYRKNTKRSAATFYSPEFIEALREKYNKYPRPRKGWLTNGKLAKKLHRDGRLVLETAEKYKPSNPEWFEKCRTDQGSYDHYSPELIAKITSDLASRPKRVHENLAMRELERKLETFSLDIIEGAGHESQEFKKLLATFGTARLFDILYKYKPEFRNIPHLKDRTAQHHSQDLENVIARVEAYYVSIIGQVKPDRLVDILESERAFPDVNQKLNAKEIADKKKMLIADEMGMGKSASAILAKEQLGSKLAIVVVPNNVISTWQGYLSDKLDEDGTQVGYFKPGMTPRVLTIEDGAFAQDIDSTSYDYILISQEKLNPRYVAELAKCDFDMLIVDEVHKVKNISEGTRAENLLKLAEKIDGDKHLALLSGTPVPNKVEDVAMVLKLLYPERFAKIDNRKLVTSIIHGDIIDIRNLLVPRMQMKSLRESIEMPQFNEQVIGTELSEKEKDIYGILLDDDELTADEKIRVFRKYVMNPDAVDPTPDIESSKIRDVSTELQSAFTRQNKIVMFVNGYVEGIIRGENNIIKKAEFPADIKIRIIDGQVPVAERQNIQEELNKSDGKMLLVVSGQTADVGVDFSSADYVCFYNEPWTEYDKRQQTSRVYRPGLSHDLTVTTSIADGTIEEGIHEYIQLKYQAIQKVLKGIPITEIEQEILQSAEKQKTQDIEGDVMLAKEWLNSPQNRLHRFFGLTKEIGEQNFHKFLLEHGDEYADCYQDIGSLGFQSNTGRVVGTLIDKLVSEKGQKPGDVTILDLASGPEILKKHIPDQYKSRVTSLDLNPAHFKGEGENRIVASFLKVPLADKSVDYANLSLALHYTRLVPSRNEYERLKVLVEMNRVLKEGGTGVIK